jgi:nitroreductase
MNNIEQYDCLLDIARRRRTIRQFKSDPVPDEYVTKIVEVAGWAPSAFHPQPWDFVVIGNRK